MLIHVCARLFLHTWHILEQYIWLTGNKHLNALPASVRWTAPEILQHPQSDENSDVITKACDVYSFAVVMWEMATLCDPFDDISDENEVNSFIFVFQN